MFLKKYLSILAVVAAGNAGAYAQSGSFCDAINTIVADAPNEFRNIRGRVMDEGIGSTKWSSTVKIPGTIGYRIVQAMGLFYEGAIIQTTDKEKLIPVYEEYKKKLSECLLPQGYKLSNQENVVAGLSDYPKLVFMKDPGEFKDDSKIQDLPPHITMEVMYNKNAGGFSIVMFIFRH